jgi:hypothetical protein
VQISQTLGAGLPLLTIKPEPFHTTSGAPGGVQAIEGESIHAELFCQMCNVREIIHVQLGDNGCQAHVETVPQQDFYSLDSSMKGTWTP